MITIYGGHQADELIINSLTICQLESANLDKVNENQCYIDVYKGLSLKESLTSFKYW